MPNCNPAIRGIAHAEIGSPGGFPPAPTRPDLRVPDGSEFLTVPKDNAAFCP
jgi:hypothetical protein